MPTIGRYQLLEKLGQGGMGIVYRALDTLLQRIVAVKVISAPIDTDPEPRERFFREARAAGQLSHKNIITIHDLGEHEGQPYLAMEYLTGQDLAARMTDPQRMSLRRKLEVASEICEGLEYAHAHGVVHRDIKPGNIFLTDSGTVKIVDFGLARLVTSELTRSNMMMGTINYMAPEQIRGERVDHRADIFSTGVVLYELLSGRRAFEGDSVASTLYKILETVAGAAAEHRPGACRSRSSRSSSVRWPSRATSATSTRASCSAIWPSTGSRLTALDSPAASRPASRRAHCRRTHPPCRTPPFRCQRTPPAPRPQRRGLRRITATGRRVPYQRTWSAVAALALGAATVAIWMTTRQPQTPAVTAPPRGQRRDRATDRRPDAKAMSAFEAEDYAAAGRYAEAVLARDPGHAAGPATPRSGEHRRGSRRRRPEEARTLFAEGKFEEASRAAGEVLSVAPGNAEAKQIMQEGAARSRGRGAEEARAQVARAKGAARSANAQRFAPAPYAAAIAAEREAQRLYQGGRAGDATVKFYEASGLFRSAEVAAAERGDGSRRRRARGAVSA